MAKKSRGKKSTAKKAEQPAKAAKPVSRSTVKVRAIKPNATNEIAKLVAKNPKATAEEITTQLKSNGLGKTSPATVAAQRSGTIKILKVLATMSAADVEKSLASFRG